MGLWREVVGSVVISLLVFCEWGMHKDTNKNVAFIITAEQNKNSFEGIVLATQRSFFLQGSPRSANHSPQAGGPYTLLYISNPVLFQERCIFPYQASSRCSTSTGPTTDGCLV